ncbi:hypothetical protein [Pedosphaera parvula]|nr:hypothetical protein [Pedosphaera parvula]
MRVVTFLVLLVFTGHAEERSPDGMIPVAKFVVSAPASGKYVPWRDPKDSPKWYAGELVVISESSFHYSQFSDAIDPNRPERDYSGKLSVFKDHIYLDHPGVPFPYRISGVADGVQVLLTWEGYEQWKRTKKVFELNLLYLEKTPKPKK